MQTPTQASGSANTLSITLAAYGASGNRAMLACGKGNREAFSEEAAWTQMHEVSHAVPDSMLATSANPTTQDTTATGSWTTAALRVGFAIEVKASVAAGEPVKRHIVKGQAVHRASRW